MSVLTVFQVMSIICHNVLMRSCRSTSCVDFPFTTDYKYKKDGRIYVEPAVDKYLNKGILLQLPKSLSRTLCVFISESFTQEMIR